LNLTDEIIIVYTMYMRENTSLQYQTDYILSVGFISETVGTFAFFSTDRAHVENIGADLTASKSHC
jgi:hypothetical protein